MNKVEKVVGTRSMNEEFVELKLVECSKSKMRYLTIRPPFFIETELCF